MKPSVSAWLKFNTVGVFGFCIQLLVLTILTSGIKLHYLAATFIAVEAALLHNFVWHERWTWAHRRLDVTKVLTRLLRFNTANGFISIVGNLTVTWLLVSRLHFHYLAANIIAVGCCALLNFFVSDRLIFRPSLRDNL